MESGLLAFSLGPVQDFIAAARTIRDLWTGSYLLSWLTAHALVEVADELELISPAVEGNRLYDVVRAVRNSPGTSPAPTTALLSTLPNTFVARVKDGVDPEALARRCAAAVKDEWKRIEREVHATLSEKWDESHGEWDERWSDQVDHLWEIRITTLRADEATDVTTLRRLVGRSGGNLFTLRMELLGRLAAAEKAVRHYPPDETEAAGAERVHEAGASNPGDPDVRPKDSLLGTWAQMGPRSPGARQMQASREFWEAVRYTSIRGTRLGARDRLGAVSLVKRFAWPVALAPRLGVAPGTLRFPDIRTLAARVWLNRAGIDWRTLQDQGRWSGDWLRWKSPEEAEARGEQPPPNDIWQQIEDARREHGQPPSYYGVLMLDGDRMGEKVGNADSELRQQISAALGDFAAGHVPGIVDTHGGALIYAGGDDVLALLPLPGALPCAHALATAFGEVWQQHALPKPGAATVSAGLVVAHAMEDLRAVLHAARTAERQAKEAGRNRLAISVRRRSGEHATVVLPSESAPGGWESVLGLQALADAFRGDDGTAASSRWTYAFREQLARLPAQPELQWAELTRLLQRGERTPPLETLRALWDAMGADRSDPAADPGDPAALRFIQLAQSAAFVARSE